MADLYVARTTAVANVDGRRRLIRRGHTIVRAGDAIMKGREHLFEPLRIDGVEQATATPGEKRAVSRRRKKSESPPAESSEATVDVDSVTPEE